jgi:hypothetical protein
MVPLSKPVASTVPKFSIKRKSQLEDLGFGPTLQAHIRGLNITNGRI